MRVFIFHLAEESEATGSAKDVWVLPALCPRHIYHCLDFVTQLVGGSDLPKWPLAIGKKWTGGSSAPLQVEEYNLQIYLRSANLIKTGSRNRKG